MLQASSLTGIRFRIALCNMYFHLIAKSAEHIVELQLQTKAKCLLHSPAGEVKTPSLPAVCFTVWISGVKSNKTREYYPPCRFERYQWLLPRCQWVWREKRRCYRRGSVWHRTDRSTGSASATPSPKQSSAARLAEKQTRRTEMHKHGRKIQRETHTTGPSASLLLRRALFWRTSHYVRAAELTADLIGPEA